MKYCSLFIYVGVFLVIILSVSDRSEASFFTFGSDCGNNASHNYFFGRRDGYDGLLYMSNVRKPSSFMRKLVQDVDFPARGFYSTLVWRITYIEALDQKRDGSGACVSIRDGGVGSGRVTLHFKSLRGGEINHLVKIYGYP